MFYFQYLIEFIVQRLVTTHSLIQKACMQLPKSFAQEQGFDWWIEITTNQPDCIYYFGPFLGIKEAQYLLPGYIEDLNVEGYQNMRVQIKQCQPKQLTICAEDIAVLAQN